MNNASDATVAVPPPDNDATMTVAGQGPRPDVSEAELPTIEGYDVQQEIGRGGMGVVYLAHQQKLNRPVALKMVLAGGQATSTDRARFMSEAELAASIQHPGVVQVLEYGTFKGLPYFALEYCPNGSLSSRLDGTPMPARDAASLVVKLAQAMQAAHDRGIIHRDLKPANILMSVDGQPKITDFGLARRGDSSHGITATGAILGTPSYMSPEQAEGKSALIGPPTDIYSLGAILYECLTGRPPFRAATAVDTVMQVVREEPVPPSQLAPRLPRDLETICLKCLQKVPGRRYASAAALGDDLQRYLDGKPIAARPVSRAERAWKLARRHPALSIAAMAVFAVLMTAISIVGWKNQQVSAERDQAFQARNAAVAEQAKNQQLVELAIEQQERLLSRITSAEWSTSPALVAERQRLLEEVTRFYTQLVREEADDPTVLIKNADAHLRMAYLHMHRSNYSQAAEANLQARSSAERVLHEMRPDDADASAMLVKSEALMGHLAMLRMDQKVGVEHYTRAVELAEKQVERRPNNDDDRGQLAECYFSLAQYFGQTDISRSGEYAEKVLKLGESMMNVEAPGYQARQIFASGLFLRGSIMFQQGKRKEGLEMIDQANTLVLQLMKETAPTARSRELTDQLTAAIPVARGLFRYRLEQTPEIARESLALIKLGVERYDRLITLNPQSMPYRFAKANALIQSGALLELVNDPAAVSINEQAVKLLEEIVHDNPKMIGLQDSINVTRSMVLVGKVRHGDLNELEKTAESLQAVKSSARGLLVLTTRYNVACAYAIASQKSPEARERYAHRAVELLGSLLSEGYFNTPGPRAQLRKDKDLKVLEDRPDFKAFEAKVPK